MTKFSGNTAKGQDIVTQDTRKAMEIWQSWHFVSNNKHYLCIVDHHSRFPVIKQVKDFGTDNLMKHVKLSFS